MIINVPNDEIGKQMLTMNFTCQKLKFKGINRKNIVDSASYINITSMLDAKDNKRKNLFHTITRASITF